jgi:transmembrane sensor
MERTHEIDAVASDWLIRRDSGVWSAADQARLEEWLNASTLNRVAFLRLELAWEDAARLKALGAGIPGDQPPPPGRWNLTPFFDPHPSGSEHEGAHTPLTEPDSARLAFEESPHRVTPDAGPASEDRAAQLEPGSQLVGEVRGVIEGAPVMMQCSIKSISPPSGARANPRGPSRRRFAVAAAATGLLTLGIGAYLALAPNGERYATPIGGLASVPMADGSNVTLNTDSQIRIALTDTERRVELGHGEAFFEVSKDPMRPFIVRAGDKRVIAVGTKFSVRREGDDVEVVVTEGKVRVEDGAAGQGSHADGSADVFLTPGSIARAGEAGVLVQRKTLPEAEEQLSWRTGVLMFRDQSLSEAIAEFNRYNVRKIVIQDPAIASLKIEGNFRATNVEAFVRLLESGFPVRAQVEPDQILLTAK